MERARKDYNKMLNLQVNIFVEKMLFTMLEFNWRKRIDRSCRHLYDTLLATSASACVIPGLHDEAGSTSARRARRALDEPASSCERGITLCCRDDAYEQEMLVSELVHSFLIPEVHRQEFRRKRKVATYSLDHAS